MPTHQFAPSNTPPFNPRVNDTYLDDGTNTGSGTRYPGQGFDSATYKVETIVHQREQI